MTVIGVSSALALPQVNTPALETWSYTQMNVVKFSHVWTIINFSFLIKENGGFYLSPTFSAGDDDGNKWQLKVYPKDDVESSKDYLSLHLRLELSNQSKVKAKFKFHIIDSKNKKTNSHGDDQLHTFTVGQTWGFRTFINRDYLLRHANELLPNDTLTVLCEISAGGDIINISGPNNTIQFEVPERQLPEHLELLFENKKLSDVTLVTRGEEFQAHKTILVARSPVFAGMFVHETAEQKQNRVEIIDLDHKVFREVLRFIYTDTAMNLEKLAKDLLAAADKYALEGLKIMCEEELCKNLNIENAADLLILAEMYSATHLKSRVIDFVNTHAKDVMDTTGFKSMANLHPHLAAEALRAFLTYFKEEQKTSNLLL